MTDGASAWGWDRGDLSPVPEPAAIGLVVLAVFSRLIQLFRK